MVQGLEEATPKAEEVKPTPVKEGAEQTPQKETPTVRTYDQKEFDTALGKGVSTLQTKLSELKAQLKSAEDRYKTSQASQDARFEARDAEVQSIYAQYDVIAQGIEDPAERDKLLSKVTLAKEKQQIARERTEAKQIRREADERNATADHKIKVSSLAFKSAEVKVAHPNIPQELLDECTSEKQMEALAKHFPEVKEEPKVTPQFDSGLSSGAGGKLSLEEQNKLNDEDWFTAQTNGKVE